MLVPDVLTAVALDVDGDNVLCDREDDIIELAVVLAVVVVLLCVMSTF